MKKSIILFAAVAALFSCAKENPTIETPAQETYSVTLTASAPTSEDAPSPASADTKTTLVDGPVVDGKPSKFVHWSQGDAIKVLFFPKVTELNASFSGPSNEFESNVNVTSSATADFKCESWAWGDKVESEGKSKTLETEGIAVYPSSAVAISTKPQDKRKNCNTEVSFVLPSTQNAVENNIESGLNFSWTKIELSAFEAAIADKKASHLRFNNACAIIELTMPSTLDKKVTSISLVSNSGVSLTGKGSVRLTSYNNMVADPFGVDVTDGDGVTLLSDADGFKAGAKYYAVVWPGNHTSGLTITFTAEDGTKATKTTGAVELTASHVKPYTFNKGLVFESASYDYVYSDGTFGNDPKPSGKTVVGVVFFNGNPRENDPALPEYCTHGLAISLAPTSTKWIGSNKFPNTNFQSHGLNSTSGSVWGYTAMCKWKDLYSTDYLQIYKTDYGTLPAGKTSGWYHGTNCEWDMISKSVDEINEKLKACGKTELSVSNNSPYWVALGYTATYMYMVKAFTSTGATYGYLSGIASAYNARPIFAF